MLLIGDKRVNSILFMNSTCIDVYNFPLILTFGYTSKVSRINDEIKIKRLPYCQELFLEQ